MRLKIDIQIPQWTKWLVGGIAIGVIVGLGVASAAAPAQFADDEVLSATKMNNNFTDLDSRISDLERRAATPQVPPGTVAAFAGSTPPAGWLLCDGSAVSRTTYSALFATIAVIYGIGDAVNTFNVPDLRAAGIRGVGMSAKFTSPTTIALAQVVNDEFQGHVHSIGRTDGSAQYPPAEMGFSASSSFYTSASGNMNNAMVLGSGSDWLTVGMPFDNPDTTQKPVRTGPETTGKAIGMNYIIRY